MNITYLIVSCVTAYLIMFMISFFSEERNMKKIILSAGVIWLINSALGYYDIGRVTSLAILGALTIGIFTGVFKFEPAPAVLGGILYAFLYKTLLYILTAYVFVLVL